jgi:hypothetical protein
MAHRTKASSVYRIQRIAFDLYRKPIYQPDPNSASPGTELADGVHPGFDARRLSQVTHKLAISHHGPEAIHHPA